MRFAVVTWADLERELAGPRQLGPRGREPYECYQTQHPLPSLQTGPSPKSVSQPLPAGTWGSSLRHPQRGWGPCPHSWRGRCSQLGQDDRKSSGAKSWEQLREDRCLEGREGLGRAGQHACMLSSLVVSNPLWPHVLQPTRLLCPWDFPGKNTGVGCHSFSRGSSWPRDWTLVSCIGRQVLYHCHLGSPRAGQGSQPNRGFLTPYLSLDQSDVNSSEMEP